MLPFEAFASPVLTLLLDIPWVATALSGWPLFGLMAQMSLRKAEALNGLIDQNQIDGVTKGTRRLKHVHILSK